MSQQVNDILTSNSPGTAGTLTLPDPVATTGLVSAHGGLALDLNAGNLGVSPFPVSSVTALVSTSAGGVNPTILSSQAGLLTLSGTTAILTAALPAASTCPGAQYIIRNLDARAHILSNSLEVGGTTNLIKFGATGSAGTKITMAASVNASVVLVSDGITFFVMASNGNNAVS